MKKHRVYKSSIKRPQEDREAENEEYWREQKGVLLCPECGNVHFKKRWYASRSDLLSRNKTKSKFFVIAKNQTCPACEMVKNHEYEGELIAEGVPNHLQVELLNLIQKFGGEAMRRDPQDRIITAKKSGNTFRVTTTENQLADRLGKKIHKAFRPSTIHFTHSREPFEVDRIRVVYSK